MPKKPSNKRKNSPLKERRSPARNVFLSLTLVPLVLGIIFIGAWLLDIEILEDLQSQITVGVFFFLLTFTTSNAIQKHWLRAAGWGLFALADIVTLAWLNLFAQIIALGLGVIGLVILGFEFYRQYRQGKPMKSK